MSTTEKVISPPPLTPPLTDELNLGPYFIQRMLGSHYVLDVDSGSTASGTQVIAYPRKTSGTGNQLWQFVPAGPLNPGWWFLKSMMGTGYVMTLRPYAQDEPTRVVMMAKDLAEPPEQLWCLQSTEKLGYWYIQSKFGASNSQAPRVIGVAGGESAAPAVASAISFSEFEQQAWGFAPGS
jgi:hypothetical protein